MKSNTPPAFTVMFPVNFLSPVHEAAEGQETLPLVPSPTVRFPVWVNAKAPSRSVALSLTNVAPVNVVVAPSVVVPESTSVSPPHVCALFRATVPIKFVVVVECKESVPAPLTVPVIFIIAAPVVVN